MLKTLEENSIDAIVCDPPYGLSNPPPIKKVLETWLAGKTYKHSKKGLIGLAWDSFVPGPELWKECFRVLKPGGHLLAFFGTRTYHLGALAVELAGFEVRDMIAWLYAMGFPKSQDVGKSIDKALGEKRKVIGIKKNSNDLRKASYMKSSGCVDIPITQAKSRYAKEWEGWGNGLKPAQEPIVVARKPFKGPLYKNILEYGTGAYNINLCRVPADDPGDLGRFPANVCHDGSADVEDTFKLFGIKTAGGGQRGGQRIRESFALGKLPPRTKYHRKKSTGFASRFFFCGKATRKERGDGNSHPTVKPMALMNWLVSLVTPPGGIVLDPFAGSGTTGLVTVKNGFKSILIEREVAYIKIIRRRLRSYKIPHMYCKR